MSTSTVTGTIQDPSGQTFNNGFWQLIFKPAYSSPGPSTDGGVAFTQLYGGSLDATGSFSQVNVNRNDTISPAGSKWTLIVTPNANGQSYSVDLNINNGAFSASAAINAVISNITVNASPLAHAYKDAEVIPVPGSGGLYFDVTLKVLKAYDPVGATWIPVDMNGGTVFAKLDGTNMPFTGQVQGKLGTVGSPSFSFTTDTATGFYRPTASQIGTSIGGTEHLRLGNFLRVGNADPIGWSSTADSTGAFDTGLSRISANKTGIGNGTQGDVSGALQLTLVVLGSGGDAGLSRTAAGQTSAGNGTAGDSSGTFKSAKTISGNINNEFWLDGTKYTQDNTGLHNAVADANTQGGGVVKNEAGITITQSTQLSLGDNSTKKSVALEIGRSGIINITQTGGTDAIIVGHGGEVRGQNVVPAGDGNSDFSLGISANINSLFSPVSRAGTQEGISFRNLTVQGNATCSGTVAGAMFDLQGLFINTTLQNVYTSAWPGKILWVRPGTTTLKINSDALYLNNNFDATNCTGGIPVTFTSAAASQIAQQVFLSGGWQHAGNGNSLATFDGAGVANGMIQILSLGVHLETMGTPNAVAVNVIDTSHYTHLASVFSGAGTTTDVFKINQTVGGLVHDIWIGQIIATNAPTKLINNAVSGFTFPTATFGNSLFEYRYNGIQAWDNMRTLTNNAAYTTTGDGTKRGIHLMPNVPATNTCTGISADAANAGFQNASTIGIDFCSNGGGSFINFNTTDSFAAGAKKRFGITNTGIDGDAAGFKHKRGTAGCATAAAAGAVCGTVVTWTTAFASANYTVNCIGDLITSGVPLNGGITNKVAASITFQTVAATAAAAQYTNIECIAIAD